jgi:hemerythrin-like domain-containing protein
MTQPLAAWRFDHANFARLLDLLDAQLAAFHVGERPDYALLLDLVHYLRHYPDRSHHPREDIAFTRLVERDPSMQLPVARRLQEHRVIAAAGETLLALLQGVVEGAVIERAAVEAVAATYLVYYRHHVAAEEREVIPRAAELLTPADWAAVAAAPAAPDPLFGDDFEDRYRELRAQIAAEAQDADRPDDQARAS